MQKQSLIKVACSIILVIVVVLTITLSFPTTASAQATTENEALKAFTKAMDASQAGNDINAKFFYEKAINEVLKMMMFQLSSRLRLV